MPPPPLFRSVKILVAFLQFFFEIFFGEFFFGNFFAEFHKALFVVVGIFEFVVVGIFEFVVVVIFERVHFLS